ncbi:hypothetical protein Hamer_G017337 [Homarus americanus]|uniref:Uncharacterized protein n=1 Tax=Homarus americanus TaxID=6706 RepID=A0A8J5MQE8_HOMAM|nr:hypothetical protein Hamer_G017337 [Homarus americanus]
MTAYRRDKSTRVQIVKMVCVTLVASAVIIGFFILTSNYLASRACVCHHEEHGHKNLHAASFLEIPRSEALVGNKVEDNQLEEQKGEQQKLMPDMGNNNLDAEDDKAQPPVVDLPIPTREEEVEEILEKVMEVEETEKVLEEAIREEDEQEALQDIMRAQMDHMKKIKLPIDLILGNPSLAIIVTCEDNNDDNEEQQQQQGPVSGPFMLPPGPRRLGPPLSILAPIMKMLSAKAASRAAARSLLPINGPQPMPFSPAPLPCPVNSPFPCVMVSPNNQMPPKGAPLSGRIPIPHNLPPPAHRVLKAEPQHHIHLSNGPMPFPGPKPRIILTPFNAPMLSEPKMDDGPRHRMLPFPFRPFVRMSPRMSMSPGGPRLLGSPERMDGPISPGSLHRGALPLPQGNNQQKNIVRVMPEAQARALPNPVNLPPFRLLPERMLAPAPPVSMIGGNRPITHMEMHAPPTPRNQESRRRTLEFGPPRVHTVIGPAHSNFPPQKQHAPQPQIERRFPFHVSKDIHISPIPKDVMTPPKPIAILQHNPPIAGTLPPPPKFAPEGRTGIVPEINPEAETFVKPPPPHNQEVSQPPNQQEVPRRHHLLVN